jgi:hypothetical protein
MSKHPCRDRIGVRGAHAPPEPMPLLVHDADRRRLLRHVQSDIVRHPNLRWCKPSDYNRPDRGTIDGSRPFRDYPRSTHTFYAVGARATAARSPARRAGQSRHTSAPASNRYRGACLRPGCLCPGLSRRSPRHAARSWPAVLASGAAAAPLPRHARSNPASSAPC